MQYTSYTFRADALPEGTELEVVYDLLSAELAEVGFDSFETKEQELLGYIPTEQIDEGAIADAIHDTLCQISSDGLRLSYSIEIIPEVNWNEEWERNYFQPIVLGDGLCMIRAPFHTPDPSVKTEIIISPKMAFGTGNHETTALVIGHLLSLGEGLRGKRVLDMGCGTGILGILALKQGAEHLTAIDIDEWAYHNVLENATLNGVSIPDALQGDASSLSGREPYDLVLANITRNILLEDLPAYVAVMRPGATIALSGFYQEDAPLLIERGRELGLSLIDQHSRNRWTLLVLQHDETN